MINIRKIYVLRGKQTCEKTGLFFLFVRKKIIFENQGMEFKALGKA